MKVAAASSVVRKNRANTYQPLTGLSASSSSFISSSPRDLSRQERVERASDLAADPESKEVEESDDDDETPPTRFQIVMLFVIVANTLEIGAQQQWKVERYPRLNDVYTGVDIVFVGFYVAEVVVNLINQRLNFFSQGWNVFDMVLTLIAIYNMVAQACEDLQKIDASGLRLLRFVRIFRLVRLMTVVPDLQMVIQGLVQAMRSLFWVLLLLFLLIYVFAVFLTMEVAEDQDDFGKTDYFSDMSNSMLTLVNFALLTEYGDIVRPIMNNQPVLLPVLFVFTLIASFGMMNVMIGIIVDNMSESRKALEDAKKIIDLKTASRRWRKNIHGRGLSAQDVARSDDPKAVEEERNKVIDEILQSLIDEDNSINFPLGLTTEDVISLLDFDNSGGLTHEEFMTGLSRLLLGDPFQLTCLSLTVIGKMRREIAQFDKKVESSMLETRRQAQLVQSQVLDNQTKMRNAQKDILAQLQEIRIVLDSAKLSKET
eukprot:TRINITY_DN104835_c0_g1_i1.p1 TRINITY_DN104835_c0_g1~~TRINITY_DN104835_c0_g1_i1.p1  ORF type:complete len:485 (+),score=74.51 TRINITY_DN104835_c0_g1_i1:95-1549(+)